MKETDIKEIRARVILQEKGLYTLSYEGEEKRAGIFAVLSDDPRPSYQDDPERIYGVSFAGFNVQFKVSDKTLTVISVTPLS